MSTEHDERLSAFLDGALPEAEADALRAELEASPALRERLAELAAVDEALRALPGPEASPALRERLRARLDEETPAASRGGPAHAGAPPRRPSRLPWAAAAAVAAAVIGLALLSGPPPAVREEEPEAPEPLAQREPEAGTLAHAPPEEPVAESLEVEGEAGPPAMTEVSKREEPIQDMRFPPVGPLEPVAEDDVAALLDDMQEAPPEDSEADLEVIHVLDLLAALDELEAPSG